MQRGLSQCTPDASIRTPSDRSSLALRDWTMSIPLKPASSPPPRDDAAYRPYILASLVLAVGGGFALATLLPLAQTLNWGWGLRWQALVQVHGQLQLMGFAGLFVMGMSMRVTPRFTGRPLPYPALGRWVMPVIALSLILRSLAEPADGGSIRDVTLILSAVLLLAGGMAFAAVMLRLLVHPASRAQSSGWFLALGALAYVAGAVINLLQVIDIVRSGLPFAPLAREQPQVFVQYYGFLLLFMGGIATRAIPPLTGQRRADASGRATAIALAVGVAITTVAGVWSSYAGLSLRAFRVEARIEDVGFFVTALALVSMAWITGVFHPRANRVAPASQTPFLFVRASMIWLAVGGALLAWYAARGFIHAAALDVYERDASLHSLTVGVTTMMVVGFGMMIVPEFAGRRLQHPGERPLILAMLFAINIATLLRIWPSIAGIGWLANTRYWPMAAAGGMAEAVVTIFALMFLQSYLEQRKPAWASAEALAARGKQATPR